MSSSESNNLKTLRIDKGLSIQEVAEELRLSTDVINKLENSEFSDLGAFTYVRGYLNHYTKILGVDAAPYIDLVPKSEINIPLVNTSHNMTKGIRLKRHSKNIVSYALGTFILVGVSVSGWFVLKNYMNSTKPNQNIEMVDSNSLEITPQNSLLIEKENLDNANNTVKDENYHYSSLIPSLDKAENQKNTTEAVDNQSQPISIEDESIIEIPEKKIESVQQESQSKYKISITATETSWVKVVDSSGKKLHNDLMQPGTLVLQSEQPVHFRIGNKNNVKVKINNESIKLSDFSIKNIADFEWPVKG